LFCQGERVGFPAFAPFMHRSALLSSSSSLLTLSRAGGRLLEWPVALELGDEFFVRAQFVNCLGQ
jgi:hypothetical protein